MFLTINPTSGWEAFWIRNKKLYLSIHWAARQPAVSISLTWVSQLEASSLLSQRSMLCDWSLQASTSLMRLSCRILNLWEEQNIENISSNAATDNTHADLRITDIKMKHWEVIGSYMRKDDPRDVMSLFRACFHQESQAMARCQHTTTLWTWVLSSISKQIASWGITTVQPFPELCPHSAIPTLHM